MHSNLSRRQFIKTTTAATFAVPYVWTGTSALGAEAKNDRINVASIGTSQYKAGTWGSSQAFDGRGTTIGRQAGQLGNMIAVADVDSDFAGKFAGYFDGKCEVYHDYRKLLDRNDIDAVTIGTPDHWHTKIAIDAMRAGKDVYCEKPLTLTVDEGKHLCRIAKETKAVFQVGTQQRTEYNQCLLKAVAIVRSGRLGKKVNAYCSIGKADYTAYKNQGPFSITTPPKSLDWDFWLGQAPKVDYCEARAPYDWRWWLEYSGGHVTDWGVHHMDIALWGLDLDHTGPVKISTKGSFPDVPNGFNVASSFDCTFHFATGQTARLVDNPENEIIFTGERGRIRTNRGGLSGKPVEELTQKDNEELAAIMRTLTHGKDIQGGHMKNFFDCIKDRSMPVSDVFSHHRVVSTCHLANISLRLGRDLQWDPVKEQFANDPEADAMLSREQRKPYQIDYGKRS